MVSPSSPFVLETRYLITFSRNGIRTLVKKIVPVQVDGISGTGESSGLSVNSENPVSVSTPSIRIWIDLRAVNDLHLFPKNFLHYGSDAGAEMAAIHHSVISTVKFHGSFVWDFIGIFFKKNL